MSYLIFKNVIVCIIAVVLIDIDKRAQISSWRHANLSYKSLLVVELKYPNELLVLM